MGVDEYGQPYIYAEIQMRSKRTMWHEITTLSIDRSILRNRFLRIGYGKYRTFDEPLNWECII